MNDKQQKVLMKILKELALLFYLIFLAGIANFIFQLFQNHYSWRLAYKFTVEWHTSLFIYGVFVIFLIILLFYALIGNIWYTTSLSLALTILIGFINEQKLANRGEPLYPSEWEMIKEWKFMITMVSVQSVLAIIGMILVFGGSAFFITRYLKKRQLKHNNQPKQTKRSLYLRITNRITLGVVAILGLFYVSQFNQPGNILRKLYDKDAYWIYYSQEMNYYNNGFIGGMLYNLPTPAMEEPAGYSKEKIEAIVEKYKKSATAANKLRSGSLNDVNIVYVMSESFSDPTVLQGIKVNQDPLPYTRSLMAEQISGEILSVGYGGGTANVEFEALTGLSMYPFVPQMISPYTSLVPKLDELPSIVSYLSDEGFDTMAIHPYNTSMYKRRDVYQVLGFDEFYHLDNLPQDNLKSIGANPYVSDEAIFDFILEQIETQESPQFIHFVTMQNHMPYGSNYDTDIEVTSAESPSVNEKIADYLQGVTYSDEALEQLIAGIEAQNEKTIVVFWGDHLPSVYGDDVMAQNDVRTKYQTPLVIYQNLKDEQKQLGTISPVYFMNEILNVTDAPLTPFYEMTKQLQAELPAFEKLLLIDGNDTEISESKLSAQTKELLSDYEMIQYDLTEGKQFSIELGMFQ